MKKLLITTAVLESATGLGLVVSPALLATLLLGGGLDSPAAMTVARVAGFALLAIGLACWLARNDSASRAARGLVTGQLLYNLGAGALFAQAGLALPPAGMGVWGVVVIHMVMAVWCIKGLVGNRS
jgi:hypothetical protein